MEHQGWINIDTVINDYIEESEQSIHKYNKLYHLAYRCMDKLGMDVFYKVETVKLPVDSGTKTAALPARYRQWVKAGILNHGGEVIPMAYNGSLSTLSDLQSNRIEQVQGNELFDPYNNVFYNYWNGYAMINLYGIPSGAPFIGSFKVDDENGVILLDLNHNYDSIVFMFIGGPDASEPYRVPGQFREAIIAWLRYMDIISMPSSRKGGIGDKQLRRQEWFNERRLAIASYKPLRLDQEYIWSIENQRYCIKG